MNVHLTSSYNIVLRAPFCIFVAFHRFSIIAMMSAPDERLFAPNKPVPFINCDYIGLVKLALSDLSVKN